MNSLNSGPCIDVSPRHNSSCLLSIAMLLSAWLCSCSYAHNELPEGSGSADSDSLPYTVIFDLQPLLDLDWMDSSQYFWKSDWGELGYEAPESYHLDYFCLPNDTGRRTGQRNLFGTNNYITLYEGDFEMLIYNNDFDYITVDYSGDEREIVATTSIDSQSEITETPDGQLIKYQPDKLFVNHFFLSLNPLVPGCILDSSKSKYTLSTDCQLAAATKIYLIAIDLQNNYSLVRDCQTALISGMAPNLELYSQLAQGEAVCHALEARCINDFVIARLICFGPSPTAERQLLWLWLKYANGYCRAEIDLTDLLAEKPTGGIILTAIDIANDYPGPEQSTQGGGMSASVSGWEGEENYYIEL